MAIVTIKASKASPDKAIDYITDKGKALLVNTYKLDPFRSAAEQMSETAKLWGKAQNESDRKYYHLKISFHPDDWVKNGGTLTESEATRIGMEVMREFFPDNESLGAAHGDKNHLHFHGLINAVGVVGGEMVDVRFADYRHIKDRVQEICAERGLNAIDWRKATREKRARSQTSNAPVCETFAERGLRERGKAVWKDELREIIDQAAVSCRSMDEFVDRLQSHGVILTRCSNTIISYKLGEHRACRGDSLGDDYTAAAIRDALAHNYEPEPEDRRSLNEQILNARGVEAVAKPMTLEHRQYSREMGRLACMSRMEVDAMCDRAAVASWSERQGFWAEAQSVKNRWWDEYRKRKQEAQEEQNALYRCRAEARRYEWMLDPRNRRASLIDVIAASIYFKSHSGSSFYDQRISLLKKQQEWLREEAAAFRSKSARAAEAMRQKGQTRMGYEQAIKELEEGAQELYLGCEAAQKIKCRGCDKIQKIIDEMQEFKILKNEFDKANAEYEKAISKSCYESVEAREVCRRYKVARVKIDGFHRGFRGEELEEYVQNIIPSAVEKHSPVAEEKGHRKSEKGRSETDIGPL